ncbi:MAG: GNAT family N-acetyltransferase [Corynebacterium sp.]|nr:GNAT family N-acetyltransferase [Corynebacterium sp.]
MNSLQFHHATATDLDVTSLYQILQLRSEIFNGEQGLSHPDLDGRDLEPTTTLIFGRDTSQPEQPIVAAARILVDDHQVAIGRVAVAKQQRGTGAGRALMAYALDFCTTHYPTEQVYVGAQAQLEQWYTSMGLQRAGDNYLDAGIPHVPLVRTPQQD